MRWTRKLGLRFRSVFSRSRVEADLQEELRDYLERETERETAAGSSPEEARRLAVLSFGGAERLKEECRDARGTRSIEDFLADSRFSIRTLRRAPTFSVTVIAALALCIGANTAIFSVVDTALFRPLPFHGQDRLMSVTEGMPSLGFPMMPFGCPEYLFVASRNQSFETSGAYRLQTYEVSGAGLPLRANGARVTASLFGVLQAAPVFGRSFTQGEDDSAKPIIVLTYHLAKNMFRDPQRALGQTVRLDRKPYEVTGIMPAQFSFPVRGDVFNNRPADFFIPMSWSKDERQDMFNNFDYSVVARLRPHITNTQAASEIKMLLRRFSAGYPAAVQKFMANTPHFSIDAHVVPLREVVTGDVKRPLLLLLAAVGLVLLIGCADVANLMFSRMVGREREFAIRAALGAGGWRLARQTFTEAFMLSLAGGVLGACLALWALPVLLRFAPQDLPRLNEIGVNWRVIAFVFGITLTTPLFFCLAPLLNVVRSAIAQQLRIGGRTSSQGKQQQMIMSGTVVAQFSLAVVLLIVAGLLLRSFIKASETSPGFRSEHLISLRLALPAAVYNTPERISNFFDRLVAEISILPGVRQTGAISNLPMDTTANRLISVEGRKGMERVDTVFCRGDALATLGVPLVRGRRLQPGDELRKPRSAVLSESLAKRLWPHTDPIGRHVKFGSSEQEPWMVVVGVVKDVKDQLTSTAPRLLIFATPEEWVNEMNVVIRTSQTPQFLASAIRQQVYHLDRSLPAGKLETLDQLLQESLSSERFRTWLLAAFAASALLLATIGIAGLLAYNAAQRSREFGIRLALGAERRDVLLLVLKHAFRLSVLGIAIGLAASTMVTRALSALLYDTSRYDMTTFSVVPLILLAVALIASTLPAWKAAHTDPVTTLKAD